MNFNKYDWLYDRDNNGNVFNKEYVIDENNVQILFNLHAEEEKEKTRRENFIDDVYNGNIKLDISKLTLGLRYIKGTLVNYPFGLFTLTHDSTRHI